MRSLPLLLLAVALSACSVGSRLFGTGDGEDAATAAGEAGEGAGPLLDARGLAVYLETMQALVQGDPVLQAEVFQDVARAAEIAPTTTNRLKLALALATPGHPSSQPLQAQRLLSELLAAGDALLPEERILTTIHLKEVEQRLILDAEAERLRQDAQAELTRQNADNARRLQQAQLENQRLRAELEDAQEKLEAITSIERSIRERENGTDAP
jgi:hypothetical protein